MQALAPSCGIARTPLRRTCHDSVTICLHVAVDGPYVIAAATWALIDNDTIPMGGTGTTGRTL